MSVDKLGNSKKLICIDQSRFYTVKIHLVKFGRM